MNKIQGIQNIALQKISNVPPFISNLNIGNFGMEVNKEKASIFYILRLHRD